MPVASLKGLDTPFSRLSTQTPPQARTISSAGLSWAKALRNRRIAGAAKAAPPSIPARSRNRRRGSPGR